jgi:hypothetical protein
VKSAGAIAMASVRYKLGSLYKLKKMNKILKCGLKNFKAILLNQSSENPKERFFILIVALS